MTSVLCFVNTKHVKNETLGFNGFDEGPRRWTQGRKTVLCYCYCICSVRDRMFLINSSNSQSE